MQVIALFRTNLLPQKNGLHTAPPPANPVLTSLARSRMMSVMSPRASTMQVISIVVNTTVVRFGARLKT